MECKTGDRGEIVIRGPQVKSPLILYYIVINQHGNLQVTEGYFKNPEATSKAMDEEGWFHTGDVGYLDEKNLLYIVDRLKEVIKYQTFQVYRLEASLFICEDIE